MPFPDEALAHGVVVLPYQDHWAEEGHELCKWLREHLQETVAVDHIGSTSVPGLAAKDCLDIMIQVRRLDEHFPGDILVPHGYRRRPEPWNNEETSLGVACMKQVFAPPRGARASNIHVREAGSPNARYALLFRDYLRANPALAGAWGRFKSRLAESVTDLADYGQIKAPAQEILMLAAQTWAAEYGWNAGHT